MEDLSAVRPPDTAAGVLAFCWLGLAKRLGEESVFVNGVRLLRLREPPNVDAAGCCAGALNIDDTVLVCELADPTPLRRSPDIDSVSSEGSIGLSVAGVFLSPPDRDVPASSARD